MRPMADQAGVELALEAVSGRVLADADRVAQTLTNLLSNAIKFSPPGGSVTVAAEPHGDLVHVRVSNQGVGIPADQLETVFDRFQQLDGSDSRQQGGTGLGLSISRGIVEQHGGQIWAVSDPGRITTFEFTLPSADQEPEPSREPASHEDSAAADHSFAAG